MFKLLELLGGSLGTIFAFLFAQMNRKAILVFSVITAFVAVVTAFLVCMKLIIVGVVGMLVLPDWFSSWFGMFVPSNYSGVIASIMSAKTCKAAYNLAKEKIALIGFTN